MAGTWTRRRFLAGAGAVIAGSYLVDPRLAFAAAAAPPDEDGYELWLRYRLVADRSRLEAYRSTFSQVVRQGDAVVLRSAETELLRGLSGLLGQPVDTSAAPTRDGAIVLGTPATSPLVRDHVPAQQLADLGPEGYLIRSLTVSGRRVTVIAGEGERGVLYGAFHLLRLLQTYQRADAVDVQERPAAPLRLANQWDNLDRTVERGYAGLSIFHWDELPAVLPRYTDYARALASVGMNGTVVNNVNANPQFLSSEMIRNLAALAEVLRAWGVTLYLSANFASPMVLGGLATADPLDAGVRAWWQAKADEIHDNIPDFGGFLVKANSEGQPGPVDYGRTHADGANALAEALRPHGGIVIWRAFVWHDVETWARESYQTFQPLDGQFADNVILQMKYGPIDFQVREPVHPLFGALPNTNSMLELQITQEYTGQATHLCYLVPLWKEVYDFDTHAAGAGTTVAKIVDGSTYRYAHSGVAGVMNFGSDTDWTRHQLAAANTHGFGRLAWNPALAPEEVAEEWVRMTFGSDGQVVQVLTQMLLASREIYEAYTSPLGVGMMTSPFGGDHFSPDPQDNLAWHKSDSQGTGFDRTVATGTGYTACYHQPVTQTFEDLATCPDQLLLFMHHVAYTYGLHSGKTVIQHIYDSHFEGLDDARRLRRLWQALGTRVDARRHADVGERFDRQVEQAALWRDTMVTYFFALARILDEKRAWVQVTSGAPSALLLGGWPNTLDLSVGNASAQVVEVAVGLANPSGWTSGTDSVSLASREVSSAAVPVTPRLTPETVAVRGDADAGGLEVLVTPAQVVTAPAGQRCVLALDAGPVGSQVLHSYHGLSPADGWDVQKGYGWVGGAPQSRDRATFDALRRDFVNDTTSRTLRVAVSAGSHDVYLLVGDATVRSYPTYVRSGGVLLAQSEQLASGEFAWLHFTVDGGSTGHEVDLELSSVPGQHWHLVALAIPDPNTEIPQLVLTDVTADPLMFSGRAAAVTARVANTTDSQLSATVRVVVPDGWSATDATSTIAAGAIAELQNTLVPDRDPLITDLRVEAAVDGGVAADRRELQVMAVPTGDAVTLALDAGTASSPVLSTYRRLSPGDAWDAQQGYGWVGTAPQSRDRNVLDALRRDFVTDNAARTLRLAVPAGSHDVFALVGDATVHSYPTYIHADGGLLAESGDLASGEFTWLHFTLDGDSPGRQVDLELTSVPGQQWHLAALLLR